MESESGPFFAFTVLYKLECIVYLKKNHETCQLLLEGVDGTVHSTKCCLALFLLNGR